MESNKSKGCLLHKVLFFLFLFSLLLFSSCGDTSSRTSENSGIFYVVTLSTSNGRNYVLSDLGLPDDIDIDILRYYLRPDVGINYVAVDINGTPLDAYSVDKKGNILDSWGRVFITSENAKGLHSYLRLKALEEAYHKQLSDAFSQILGHDNFHYTSQEITEAMTSAAGEHDAVLNEVYCVSTNDRIIGHAIVVSASGSQGLVKAVVMVDPGHFILGIRAIDGQETLGIGAKVLENQPNSVGVPVLDQFIGKTNDQPLAVGKNIDAISGATVTTRAITTNANAALAVADTIGN